MAPQDLSDVHTPSLSLAASPPLILLFLLNLMIRKLFDSLAVFFPCGINLRCEGAGYVGFWLCQRKREGQGWSLSPPTRFFPIITSLFTLPYFDSDFF